MLQSCRTVSGEERKKLSNVPETSLPSICDSLRASNTNYLLFQQILYKKLIHKFTSSLFLFFWDTVWLQFPHEGSGEM